MPVFEIFYIQGEIVECACFLGNLGLEVGIVFQNVGHKCAW